MKIRTTENLNNKSQLYNVEVLQDEFIYLEQAIKQRTVELVAQEITKYIIQNKFNEIMKCISPEAIANMCIAESGAKIKDILDKKLPDKVVEIEKINTQIYQRGLFGGMTRI